MPFLIHLYRVDLWIPYFLATSWIFLPLTRTSFTAILLALGMSGLLVYAIQVGKVLILVSTKLRIPACFYFKESCGRICRKGIELLRASAELIYHDIDHLFIAFRSGQLPIEILHEAVARGLEESARCPFLDDENSCTVYEYRPLICVGNNTIYMPRNDTYLLRIEKIMQRNTSGKKVPQQLLGNKMCQSCHNKCNELPKRHPLANVTIRRLLESQDFLIRLLQIAGGKVYSVEDVPSIIAKLLDDETNNVL